LLVGKGASSDSVFVTGTTVVMTIGGRPSEVIVNLTVVESRKSLEICGKLVKAIEVLVTTGDSVAEMPSELDVRTEEDVTSDPVDGVRAVDELVTLPGIGTEDPVAPEEEMREVSELAADETETSDEVADGTEVADPGVVTLTELSVVEMGPTSVRVSEVLKPVIRELVSTSMEELTISGILVEFSKDAVLLESWLSVTNTLLRGPVELSVPAPDTVVSEVFWDDTLLVNVSGSTVD
jgi:hypothetical protein